MYCMSIFSPCNKQLHKTYEPKSIKTKKCSNTTECQVRRRPATCPTCQSKIVTNCIPSESPLIELNAVSQVYRLDSIELKAGQCPRTNISQTQKSKACKNDAICPASQKCCSGKCTSTFFFSDSWILEYWLEQISDWKRVLSQNDL